MTFVPPVSAIRESLIEEFALYSSDPKKCRSVYANLENSMAEASKFIGEIHRLPRLTRENARAVISKLVGSCADGADDHSERLKVRDINSRGFEAQIAYVVAYAGIAYGLNTLKKVVTNLPVEQAELKRAA